MNKIQIKNIDGNVIFEYEKENNTIKDTVEEAVKQGVSLCHVYLRYADLRCANLRYADLRCADLSYASLSTVNLSYADLSYANISNADLSYANLSYANISDAYLRYASLSYANLCGANLDDADFNCAYLNHADLKDANFINAVIIRANFNNAKNIPYFPIACPSEGSFIAWKKIIDDEKSYLVKLEIPEDAKRCSATTNKCRCSKAKVLEIKNLESGECINKVINYNRLGTIYKVGEMVYPDSFDENRWNECSHGIHFFINKEDAINY